MDHQVVEYLRENKEKYGIDVLKKELVKNGHDIHDVEEAAEFVMSSEDLPQHEEIPLFPDPSMGHEDIEPPMKAIENHKPVENSYTDHIKEEEEISHHTTKKTSPFLAAILSITGIYFIIWFYMTNKNVIEATGRENNPVLFTLGLFLPIVNLIVLWKYSGLITSKYEHSNTKFLLFVLFLLFFPAAVYFSQTELNHK